MNPMFRLFPPFAAGLLAVLLMAGAAPAFAAAPQVRTQGPGFYRMMLGDIEVTALLDGTHPFPIDTVMEHVSGQDVARDLARAQLAAPVQGSINAFLLNTGTRLILVDTGAGLLYGDCCGKLLANLRAAGYRPEQVDQVWLTHLHKDHVGGIVLDQTMAFPHAVLRVNQADAAYWLDPASKARAPAFLRSFFDSAVAATAPYIAAGRFQTFSDHAELAPGMVATTARGHTEGHTIFTVTSAGQTLLAWGDIVHVAAIQLQQPGATVKYDTDAGAAAASRRALLDQAASTHALIGAAHIAFPGLGHIRKSGAAYEWIPVNYDAAVAPGGAQAPSPSADRRE
jgi:glyoxylase-like metal-dependent hydrolase (beta-lactamase superfamily II)